VAVNPCNKQRQNVFHMVENGVCLWEKTKEQTQGKWRHPRYYGFAPSGLFLHGFGPWPVTAGECQSVQVSEICTNLATLTKDMPSGVPL
jgi:hypothetical protein